LTTHGVLVVGRVEDADVAGTGDSGCQRSVLGDPLAAEHGQAGAGCGIGQVSDDVLQLSVVQALDAAHQHQPLTAEQAQRVARCDHVGRLLLADRDLLDAVLVELASQTNGGSVDLGPVAAGDQVRRLMRQRPLLRP
jgi:hypothetical protein